MRLLYVKPSIYFNYYLVRLSFIHLPCFYWCYAVILCELLVVSVIDVVIKMKIVIIVSAACASTAVHVLTDAVVSLYNKYDTH